MKFRKKPVVIDAIRYTGDNIEEVWEVFSAELISGPILCDCCDNDSSAHIETLEGTMECSPGDWIIRGVQGELYPCKPDIFEATYEPAEPEIHDLFCDRLNLVTLIETDKPSVYKTERLCVCRETAELRASEWSKAEKFLSDKALLVEKQTNSKDSHNDEA